MTISRGSDPLASAYLKIEWANKQIADLKNRIVAFLDTSPYHLIREENFDRQQLVWRVGFDPEKPIPDDLSLVMGDAVHNLRSALDHLACAAVGSNVSENTAFPVWRKPRTPTTQDLVSLTLGKVQGASQKMIDMISACESYVGGNHQFLWEVDHLDIIDKHRKLLLATTGYEHFTWDAGVMLENMMSDSAKSILGKFKIPSMMLSMKEVGRHCVSDNDELFALPLDQPDLYGDIKFTFGIAIGEPGPLLCEPIIPKLTQLSDAVKALIEVFALVL